ncbi:MAG TPA: acyl-CoA desaturase [Rhizomicrobium sp.]|nr:acyl-CoA desaturase [Rhizomicrobium sp.]
MAAPRIRFLPDDGFRTAVTARVNEYFAQTGKARTAGPAIYAKAIIYGALAVVAYLALLTLHGGALVSLGLALGYGVSILFLAMNLAHDAAHTAVTGHRRTDFLIQRAVFVFLGVDGYLWRMRHDGSHHVFPNVNGCDIDIDQNPILRLSPNHGARPWQRYQHLYAVFAYMLTLLHSIFVSDLIYLRKTSLANMRGIRHARGDVAMFWAGKAIYFTILLWVPLSMLDLPWWQVLLGYVLVTAVQSLIFVFLLVGTHFSIEASFPKPDGSGTMPTSWAAHAIETSVDWSPESRLAHFFSGGANAHAAHHLFPRVSASHYAAITSIVRATAREYGLRYNETTFLGAIARHFSYLKSLAREESAERDFRDECECDDRDGGVYVSPAA